MYQKLLRERGRDPDRKIPSTYEEDQSFREDLLRDYGEDFADGEAEVLRLIKMPRKTFDDVLNLWSQKAIVMNVTVDAVLEPGTLMATSYCVEKVPVK